MRIQTKTLLVFLSPLILGVAAADFQRAGFGLWVIPTSAQRAATGRAQGFPS